MTKSPKNFAAGHTFPVEPVGTTEGRKSNVAVACSMLSLSAAAVRPDAAGGRCRREGGGALSLVTVLEAHRRQVRFASFVRSPRLIRSHSHITNCSLRPSDVWSSQDISLRTLRTPAIRRIGPHQQPLFRVSFILIPASPLKVIHCCRLPIHLISGAQSVAYHVRTSPVSGAHTCGQEGVESHPTKS